MIRQTITTIRYNKTYCTLIACMIIASYSFNVASELNDKEPFPDYYQNLLPMYMRCDLTKPMTSFNDQVTRNQLKDWLNCFSYNVIGNDRVIPVIASVTVVYLTYVLANMITNNRIIGLIAMGAMTVNPLLTKFDSSPTYDQVWSMFFLLSIVLLYKKPIVGLAVFPLSVLSKILAAGYIPGLILNIILDKRLKHRDGMILGLGIISVIGFVTISMLGVGNTIGIYPERLLDGFLRIFENIWPVFPALIGAIVIDRFFMPKQKPEGKKIVLVWITWILLTTPLVYLFTESQLQFGYRFVPFASFFSIYLGIVGVQLGNFITEARLRKPSLKSISHN